MRTKKVNNFEITVKDSDGRTARFDIRQENWAEGMLRALIHSGFTVSILENKLTVLVEEDPTDRAREFLNGTAFDTAWYIDQQPATATEAITQTYQRRPRFGYATANWRGLTGRVHDDSPFSVAQAVDAIPRPPNASLGTSLVEGLLRDQLRTNVNAMYGTMLTP